MKTNKIRLTESQLRNMITEAVRNVLNENEPYFGNNIIKHYRGDYLVDTSDGDLNVNYPRGKYARADMKKTPSKEKLSKLKDFKDSSTPETEFDAAGRLHTLRQDRDSSDYKMASWYKEWERRVRLYAMKVGIPKELIMKLSPNELIDLYTPKDEDDFE